MCAAGCFRKNSMDKENLAPTPITERESCTISVARLMVKKGLLRGIVHCPVHGHHNPYHMSKTGEGLADAPTERESWREEFENAEFLRGNMRGDLDYISEKQRRNIKSFISQEIEKAKAEGITIGMKNSQSDWEKGYAAGLGATRGY